MALLRMLDISFVVFAVICGIFAEFRTVVMVFCGIFVRFFRTVVSTFGLLGLWWCHFGRFVVTNQCSLCSNLHFSCFFLHFLSFSEAVRTWSLVVCKGGRDMAGIIPTTFAVSCNRPAAQPFLLSFSSSFLLPLSLFQNFLLFSTVFYTFPSSFLFFHLFSIVFQ